MMSFHSDSIPASSMRRGSSLRGTKARNEWLHGECLQIDPMATNLIAPKNIRYSWVKPGRKNPLLLTGGKTAFTIRRMDSAIFMSSVKETNRGSS